VKLSSGGTLQWSRTIGGTGGDYGFSIKQTSDGGYILGGTTLSSGAGNYDLQILKLDQIGSLQWNRTEGGLDFDYCYSIIQTNDGGYAAAGSTASFGAGGYDVYMVKLDSGGLLQWNRTIGGAANDAAYSVIQTSDGGYALAGYTYSFGEGDADIYIIKLDSLGNTCGNFSTPSSSTGSGGVQGNPSTLSTSPAISVFSQSPSAGTGGLLTTVCVVGIHPVYNEELEKYELLQNFPNPFNPVTNLVFKVSEMGFVKLAVFDMLGREVIVLVNEMLLPGKYEVSWDASGYPSGVYIYELIVVQNGASGGKYSAARKMVLAK
jgi:hypothetical protein